MKRCSVFLAALIAMAAAYGGSGQPTGGGIRALEIESWRLGVVTVIACDEKGRELRREAGTRIARGEVLTSRRLLIGASDVRCLGADGTALSCSAVIFDQPITDTTVIAADASEGQTVLPAYGGVTPAVAEELTVLTPHGAEEPFKVTVRRLHRSPLGYIVCELDKVIAPHLSGCPVINRDGRLVATAVSPVYNAGLRGFCLVQGRREARPLNKARPLTRWLRENRETGPGEQAFIEGIQAAWAEDFEESEVLLTMATLADDTDPDRWLYLGWCRHRTGDFARAIDAYKQALAVATDPAPVLANLAVSYAALGRLDDALATYERALQIVDERTEVNAALCELLSDAGLHREIIDCCSQAAALEPDNPRLRYALGRAHAMVGRNSEATAEFRKAVALDGDYEDAWRELGKALYCLSSYEEALAAEKEALKMTPRDFEALVAAGDCHTRLGHNDDAAFLYRKATDVRADYPPAWRRLGMAYYSLEEFSRAANALDTCLLQTARDAVAHSYRGRALNELSAFEEAMEHHLQAIELDGDNAEFHYHKARTCMCAGWFEKAISSYDKTLELNPNHVLAQVGIAVACKRLGRYEEALAAFEKAEKIDPGCARNHRQWGMALFELDRFEEAAARYARAVACDPGFHEAHFEMGLSYVELKQYQRAVPVFTDAVRTGPDDAESHYYLAFCLEKTGKYWPALDASVQALRLRSDHVLAHLVRGKAYWHLEDNVRAIFSLGEAVRLQEDLEEAHYYLARAYLRLGDRKLATKHYKRLQELESGFVSSLDFVLGE
ncbi:MAG: tetratricopeptide repeat protein [Planctomycetota bacterium]|jgi:tetratricopeptide (TPR) repeat protein